MFDEDFNLYYLEANQTPRMKDKIRGEREVT